MRVIFPTLSLLFCATTLSAQDPFEIHIYEYEPLSLGEYSLEAHLNFVTQGTTLRDGGLLPTEHQTHLTLEPTFGLSENLALGFMILNAWEPEYSPQFAGWRVLPHFYAPQSWHLLVRLGFVAEFSFQNTRHEENSRRVELRPIIDREFSRWQVVFNPVFERALHGPGTAHGWNFEPAMLLRWKRKRFSPSVEYYGEIESINAPAARSAGGASVVRGRRLETAAQLQHQLGNRLRSWESRTWRSVEESFRMGLGFKTKALTSLENPRDSTALSEKPGRLDGPELLSSAKYTREPFRSPTEKVRTPGFTIRLSNCSRPPAPRFA